MKWWEHGKRDSTGWIWSSTWILDSICLQATRIEVQTSRCWVVLVDEARICPQSVVLTYEGTLESRKGRIGFLIQEIWVGPENLLSSSQVKLLAGLGTTLEKHCLRDTGRPACSSKRSGSNHGKWDLREESQAGHSNNRILSEILNCTSQYSEVDDLPQVAKLAERVGFPRLFSPMSTIYLPFV